MLFAARPLSYGWLELELRSVLGSSSGEDRASSEHESSSSPQTSYFLRLIEPDKCNGYVMKTGATQSCSTDDFETAAQGCQKPRTVTSSFMRQFSTRGSATLTPLRISSRLIETPRRPFVVSIPRRVGNPRPRYYSYPPTGDTDSPYNRSHAGSLTWVVLSSVVSVGADTGNSTPTPSPLSH